MFQGGTELGISISDRSIEIVEISQKGLNATVQAAVRTNLAPGVVDKGVIIDEAKLVIALKAALGGGKPKSFSTKRAVFSLPDVVSFLHVFRFPPTVTQEEMRSAVRFQAEELIPIKPEETVYDFVITEHGKDHVDVLYVAVERAVFMAYVRVMRAAGVDLVAVGVDAAALACLLSPKKDPKEATLIADLGARTATLLAVDLVGIRSSFTRFTAGEAITQAVADAMKIDLEQAEALKIKNGLTGEVKVKAIVQPFVERLAKDIVSTCEWHETHHDSVIKDVALVGGTSLLAGINEAIVASIGKKRPGLSLRPLDPFAVVKLAPKLALKKAEAILFAPAVGAALWSWRAKELRINLLTSQAVYQRKPFLTAETKTTGQKVKLIGAIVFLLVAVAGLILAFSVRKNRQEEPVVPAGQEEISEIDAAEFTIPYSLTSDGESAALARLVRLSNASTTEVVAPQVTEEVEGVATGQVTLQNTSTTAQSLVATTRLLTPEGILFRLTSAVTVPAEGEVTAEVYADQPGASGDIPPATFTIPGLAVSRQAEVFAESDAVMNGGLLRVGTVAQADLDAATAIMVERISRSAAEFLGAEILPDDLTAPELTVVTPVTVISAPTVGEEASEIVVTMTYNLETVVVSSSEVDAFVRRSLDEEGIVVPEDLVVTYTLEAVEIGEVLGSGRLTVTATVNN